MRFVSLVSLVLLLCCVSPLRAGDSKDTGEDADHADIKIDPLPAGWTGGLNEAAHTFLVTNDELAMVQINSSWHDENFQKFCKVFMEREAAGSILENRKATDPKPASVGPKGTLEYDVTGKLGDTEKHVHIYMMPVRKTWGFMNCKCDADEWEKYKKVFEEMAKNAK